MNESHVVILPYVCFILKEIFIIFNIQCTREQSWNSFKRGRLTIRFYPVTLAWFISLTDCEILATV